MQRFKIAAVLCLTLGAAVVQQSLADEPVKHYAIKQSAPSVGTNMTKDIVKAGTIPLNKHFDELTADQKAILRSEYDHMPDTDEPPFPVKGLFSIYKSIAIAHENLELQFQGPLTAYVLVDSEGNPKSVEITASPDEQITNAVTYALMNVKYKPAVCSGHACAMQMALHAELVSPSDSGSTGNNSDLRSNFRH